MTSHPLEPDSVAMRSMADAAMDYLIGFVDGLPAAPANAAEDDLPLRDLMTPPPEAPGDMAALLDVFGRAAAPALETAGPGFMGYIPGGGLFTSALAELLARTVNRYTGIASLAPGLVALEQGVIGWLCAEFGLPRDAGGVLVTGGSMATLAAVVAARHDRLGHDFTSGTVYVTPYTHHCVAKATRIAGLRTDQIRTVPTTDDLRMNIDAAAQLIERDRALGLRPFLLVATAGTTDTGTIDPLAAAADLARNDGLWFHVDAAYGGFFQLTQRGRRRLAGIEAADSIVLDPHKGLFLPYGTGLLLVRDPRPLAAAHSGEGHYLQDADIEGELPNFSALGPELTREYRGLRLWLPLHLHGVGAFRAALDEKLDLAAYVYEQLAADPMLEVPRRPELSTVAFRLRDGDDEDNQHLLRRINATQRVSLSSTRILDRFMLRVSILSHRTHREHVVRAVELIRSAARGQ